LLIATRSPHKLAELRTLLQLPHTELLSLDDVGIADIAPENADTFEENARDKAVFYAARTRGLPTLADDSGIEVDALDGAPGVKSHRYAGEPASDERNNEKLLEALTGVPDDGRTARYRCALAFIQQTGNGAVVRVGTLDGTIAREPRGSGGFGYDPIFEPAGEPRGGRTVGQLSQEEKDRISHRAEAARLMGDYLRSIGY
jgi:XTP/dITP diphosphohydrolase